MAACPEYGTKEVDKAAVGDQDCLLSWGANSYGQLGSGNRDDTILPTPTTLPSSVARRLRQITGGGGHTTLLTDDGDIYVCGWNKNGQLGIASTDVDATMFRPLPNLPSKMIKVSCGWSHTLALSERGEVFVWGSNTYGQLGEPRVLKQSSSPVQLSSEVFSHSKVCDVTAGLRHSMALTDSGLVYSWGDGRKGQLGHGPCELSPQPSPKCITGFESGLKVKFIAAGAYHSTAVTERGDVFAWGLNQHGQCGVGEFVKSPHIKKKENFKLLPPNDWIVNVYCPLRVEGIPPVTEVHCGWSHTVAVTAGERKLFSWGRNDYGQLGREVNTEADLRPLCCPLPTEIPTLKNVRQVTCGSEHAVVLINGTDSVITFGWNEHGICGTGDEANVHVPFPISKPLEGWKVRLIGTGAGHSLVLASTTYILYYSRQNNKQ